MLQDESAPSKSSIGRFIQNNEKLFDEVINEVVKLLIARDEINFDKVYIDGTKIEANANKYSFVWRKAVNSEYIVGVDISSQRSLSANLNSNA